MAAVAPSDSVEVIHGDKEEQWNLPPFTFESIPAFNRHISLYERILYAVRVTFKMASGQWYCVAVIGGLGQQHADDVYDRCLAEWATMGIVSSLMLSFTFSSFYAPVSNTTTESFYGFDNVAIIGILTFVSITCSLIALASSVLLSMGLMTLPRAASVAFVSELRIIVSFPEVFTVTGVIVFGIAAIFSGFLMYGPLFAKVSIIFGAAFVIGFTILFATIVLILDRRDGLWARTKAQGLKRAENQAGL